MRNELLDILSAKTTAITNEQLISYLTGKMSDDEKHELEKTMLNSGMDNDAVEGLEMVASKENLHQYELELNKLLREKLQQKKMRRQPAKKLQLNYLLLLTGGLLAFLILIWLIFHLVQSSV
jgi:hypothetical protein